MLGFGPIELQVSFLIAKTAKVCEVRQSSWRRPSGQKIDQELLMVGIVGAGDSRQLLQQLEALIFVAIVGE